MVGKQGGHLWHGKCPTILGQDGCGPAQTLLLDLLTFVFVDAFAGF